MNLLCISPTNHSFVEPTIFLDKVSAPFQKSFISNDPIPLSKTTFVGYDPDGYIDDFAYIAAVPASTFVNDGNQYISPLIHRTGSDSENWLVEDWTDYLSLDGGMKQVVLIGDFSATQIKEISKATHTKPYPIITGSTSAEIAAKLAYLEWQTSDVAVFALAQDTFENLTEISGTASHTFTNVKVETFDTTVSVSGIDSTNVTFTPPASAGWLEGSFDWSATGVITHRLMDPNDRVVDYSYYRQVVFERDPNYVGTPIPLQFWLPKTMDGEWSMILNPWDSLDTTVDCSIRYHPGFEQTITVPSNAKWLNISVNWDNAGTDVNLALIDPDGRLVQWAPAGSLFSALGGESLNMPYPSFGDWTLLTAWMNATQSEQNTLSIDWEISTLPDDLQAHLESAANGAVIASLMNAPLLYVSRTSVPEMTRLVAKKLGVTISILVDPNNIHSASLEEQLDFGLLTNVNTHSMLSYMIRSLSNQNDVVISIPIGSGDELFTPSAYSAAVHGAPIFSLCGENNQMTTRAEETWAPYQIGPELNVYITSRFTTRTENGWYDERIPNSYSMRHTENSFESFLDARGAFNDSADQDVVIISPVDLIKISFDRSIQGHFSSGRIPATDSALASVMVSRATSHRFLFSSAENADTALLSLYAYTDGYTHVDNFGQIRTLRQYDDSKSILTSAGFEIESHVGYNEVFASVGSQVSFWELSTHGTLNTAPTDPPERPGAIGYFSMRDLDAKYGFEVSESEIHGNADNIINPVQFDEEVHHRLMSSNDLETQIGNIGSPIVIICACLLGGSQMPIMLMEHGAVGVTASPRTVYFQPAGMLSVLFTEALANGNTTGRALSRGLSAVSADYSDPFAPEEPIDYANQQILFGDPDVRLYNQVTSPHIAAVDPLNATFGGHLPGRGIPQIAAIGETAYLPDILTSFNIEYDFFGVANYSDFIDLIQLHRLVLIEPGISSNLISRIDENTDELREYVETGGTLFVLGASGDLGWVPLSISFADDDGGSSITIEDTTHPLVSLPQTLSSNVAYDGHFESLSSNYSIIATDGSNPVFVASSFGFGKLALTTTHPTGQERNNTISNAISWPTIPSLFLEYLDLSQEIIWAGDRVTIWLKITDSVGTELSEINLNVWVNDTDVSSLIEEDPNEAGLFNILLNEQWTTETNGIFNIHIEATKSDYDSLSLTLIGFMYIRPSPWLALAIAGGIIGLLIVSWVYIKYRRGDPIIPRRKKKGYVPSQEPSKKERKQKREMEKKKREKEDNEFDAGEFFGV
jgi:hypothetical protein